MNYFNIVPIEDLKRYAYERMRHTFNAIPFLLELEKRHNLILRQGRTAIIHQYYIDRGWHAG